MSAKSVAYRMQSKFFQGKSTTLQHFLESELLVYELPAESSLRWRYPTELNELRDWDSLTRA